MNGMILAAGRGDRMRPLTYRVAKPALPVLNRPLLSYAAKMMARGGVRQLAMNLHHLPETIQTVMEQWTPEGMSVSFFHEEELLGTGGGLKNAASALGDKPFFLSNGDFMLDIDLAEVLETHRRADAVVTLVLVPYQERLGYTPVWVSDGRVLAFGEPAPDPAVNATRYIFAGVHWIEPSVLDRIPANQPVGIVRPIYTGLLAQGAIIAAHMTAGVWFEFGTPGQYLRRSLRLLAGPGRSFVEKLGIRIDGTDEKACVLGEDVRIAGSAAFVGRAVLGDRVAVGRAAWVEDSIVGNEAVVSYGCEINDCIVGEGVILPPESRFENRILLPRGQDLSGLPGAVRQDELVHFPL